MKSKFLLVRINKRRPNAGVNLVGLNLMMGFLFFRPNVQIPSPSPQRMIGKMNLFRGHPMQR